MLDVDLIRVDFPIFAQPISGKPLIYMDNAATTQKPKSVIQAVSAFYTTQNATVRRGLYPLAVQATQAYEQVREQVRRFINAVAAKEIIFTYGTTDGINLVAQAFVAPRLKAGDAILLSAMEHHSNLIPWQQLCLQKGAALRLIPMDEKGNLRLENIEKLLDDQVKLLAITHVSNALGTINPIETICALARERGIPVLIDAAQSAGYYPIDVLATGCDFLVFSGHKMFAPTGIGVLYGKIEHLEAMQPQRFGGEMIRSVSFEETTFAEVPARLEAGTPNVEGIIGLGAAIRYIQSFEKQAVVTHLDELTQYATQQLSALHGVRLIGTAPQKSAIVSFLLEKIHPHDAATFLGEAGIALRAGHHCAQPVMDFLGIPGTLRASFSIYNTKAEIDAFVAAVEAAQLFFK